ncbi:MAG: NYN domain-containing protein [Planctomycetota bacterium]
MFNSTIDRIKQLAEKYPERIKELEWILDRPTNVYIDFANVYRWQEKLGWHIDLKRLKQLLGSFDTIKEIKFYDGTLVGKQESEDFINQTRRYGYIVITKPVKTIRISLDVSSIPPDSPAILKEFIREPLLRKFNIETVILLNSKLKELNQQGILFIEDLKCNFDVEISTDMMIDHHLKKAENFILWSGDSDFADTLKQLLDAGKKVVLFATPRRVSAELNALRSNRLIIFDIQKIREFICWPKEMKP